ncbi:hypothetical protein ABZP36_019512 [Zizania latifolia]
MCQVQRESTPPPPRVATGVEWRSGRLVAAAGQGDRLVWPQHIRRRVVFSHKVLCSVAALLLESGNADKDLFDGAMAVAVLGPKAPLAEARVNAAAGAFANPLPAVPDAFRDAVAYVLKP